MHKHNPIRNTLLAALLVAFPAAAGAGPSVLIDVTTGRVIEHEDAFQRWYPASLTKLMTAYVAFRAIKAGEIALDSPVMVSKNSAGEPPSKMGYKPGSVMTLDNALKMLLIKSANDIATAVGENVAGSEKAFVARMNAEARRLGMTGTRFVNAHGLHAEDQYTTARDMAVLAMTIRNEFPEHAHYFAIEGLSIGKRVLRSYNTLIGRFDGADGMKTGFICPSGFNLVASATRDGRTLAAIVLGEMSPRQRANKAADLLARGFDAEPGSLTVVSLRPYGQDTETATDMRPTVCGGQKAKAEQAESADAEENKPGRSPHIGELKRALRVVEVGLGGANGPVPRARLNADGREYADVPIPTWRPDRPPPGATVQGDTPPAAKM